MIASPPYIEELLRVQRLRRALVVGFCLAVAAPVAVLAAERAQGGSLGLVVAAVLALAVPFVLWRSLANGVLMLVIFAAGVEQFRYDVAGSGLDAVTDRIPVFSTLSDAFGLTGVNLNLADILLIALLVAWLFRAVAGGGLRLPRTQLSVGIALLLLVWLTALAVGLTRGGNLSVASYELRPFVYLAGVYLLASQMLAGRRAVHTVLWSLVLTVGAKAVLGVYILFQARNLTPRPEAILAHEEAFFFGLFAALTVALWIFGLRGRLRTTATVLLPVVLLADLGNARRVAWLILAADLVILLAVTWACAPSRRWAVARIALATVAALAIYLPVFWSSTSVFAEPARAARSLVDPGSRDASSDTYRSIEYADLGVNIKRAGPLGAGLGMRIDYSAYPITDLTGINSFITYIPHNGMLWVWMRAGAAGELTLWFVVAAGILAACRLARSRDPMYVLLGAVGTCAVAQWVIMGTEDLGFYWFRIAIVMGCVLGTVSAAGRQVAAGAAADGGT